MAHQAERDLNEIVACAGPVQQGPEQDEQEDETSGDAQSDAENALGGDPLVLNWNGAFAGTTQGTVHYACEFNPGTELPLTGTGMRQRTANFTNGTAEYLTGTCSLDLCSTPSASRQLHSGQDEDTQP